MSEGVSFGNLTYFDEFEPSFKLSQITLANTEYILQWTCFTKHLGYFKKSFEQLSCDFQVEFG